MSRIIGVTGGVGAGKSTVLSHLRESYGALIIEMDAVGKEVMEPGGICFRAVADLFGEKAVKEDGTLDRPYIANIVFHDDKMLEKLNAIIHPAVRSLTEERIREAEKEGIPYVVLESALLLDAGYQKNCDEVWYIYADPDVRTKRLRETRGYSDERIRSVMQSQKSDAYFRKYADLVIDNNGDLESMEKQIKERLTR